MHAKSHGNVNQDIQVLESDQREIVSFEPLIEAKK